MTHVSFFAQSGMVHGSAIGPMDLDKAKRLLALYAEDAVRPTVSEALAEHDLEMARQLTAAIREVQSQQSSMKEAA